MMALYSAALALGLLLSSPWWLLRMGTTQRYREGLRERLGAVPSRLRNRAGTNSVIWVHAVSVGEVLAATRLVGEFETAVGEGWRVVISTTTRTGQALARERFGADRVFYFPLDFAWAVRAYLRALRPAVLLLMESELWPRMLHECEVAGVPVAVVNARVSDRSFARAMHISSIWGRALRMVSLWLAQSDEDARRLQAMGARAGTVQVAGNLKYDVRAPQTNRVAELIREQAKARNIFVAGSTHSDATLAEEAVVLRAMREVWEACPETVVILAPRHPERFDEVATLASTFGEVTRMSALVASTENGPIAGRILLLDTVGDLASVYAVATASFVGGSLVPRGGHNPLEPAQFGVPVLMGPSCENFRDIVSKMKSWDALIQVNGQVELQEAMMDVFAGGQHTAGMGKRGQQVYEQQQGATARTVQAVIQLIQGAAQ